uniref:hypothetical protein n=1 Tax=Hymenobacter rubripertinctus TaxID=2029981 RepID=UPI001FE24E8C
VAAGFALVFGLAVAAAVLAQVSTAALATRQRGLKHGSKILLTPHYTTAKKILLGIPRCFKKSFTKKFGIY